MYKNKLKCLFVLIIINWHAYPITYGFKQLSYLYNVYLENEMNLQMKGRLNYHVKLYIVSNVSPNTPNISEIIYNII